MHMASNICVNGKLLTSMYLPHNIPANVERVPIVMPTFSHSNYNSCFGLMIQSKDLKVRLNIFASNIWNDTHII